MKIRMNFGALKKFNKRLAEAFGGHEDKINAEEFMRDVVKTAGKRCQAKTEKRTPVDTGQLRQNWDTSEVVKRGFNYTVDVINPVEYAEYVEFGHRIKHKQTVGRYVPAIGKKLVNPYVVGKYIEPKYMVTRSIEEVQNELPNLVEEKINKKLTEIFK